MKKLFTIILLGCLLQNCTTKNAGEPDDSGLYIKLLGGGKGEKVNDAFLTNNGEIIGVGSARSFSTLGIAQNHIYIFKIDAQGNKIWQKAIEGTTNETIEGNAISLLPDGKFLVAATSDTIIPPFRKKLNLLKVSAEGVKENIVAITGQNKYDLKGISIQIQPNGNSIILGKRQDIKTVDETQVITTENYMAKFDIQLNKLYDKFYSSESFADNTPQAMKFTGGNDFLIAGSVNNAPRLILINDELGIKWDYSYKSLISQGTINSTQLIGNGYVSAGTSVSNGTLRPFLLKTNLAGVYEWHKTIDVQNVTAINAITSAPDGGFLIVGTVEITEGESKHTNIWVGKVGANGDFEWQKNFGGRKNDVGKSVIYNQIDSYLILGNIGFEENSMVALIKMDKNGNLVK